MDIKYGKYIILVLLVLSNVGCVSIQMRTAENFYTEMAYYDALRNYEAVALKTQDPEAIIKTAQCYQLLNFNVEAEKWYALAFEKGNVEPNYQYEYAKVLMKNGNYELARKYFNKYSLTDRTNEHVKLLINSCDSLQQLFYYDTTMYSIKPLEWNKLNSSNFSPRFYKNGVVFVSDREHANRAELRNPYTGKNTYDLFYVKLTEFDNWLQPEPLLGNVNGIYNEGPCALTNSQDTMYFTRNNYTDNVVVKNNSNLSTLKIFRAVNTNAEWVIDKELEINNEEYSVAHPTLSPNGNIMVFMSDMPWGYGGTDLYYSIFKNGIWSTPKNLGDIVNSSQNEVFPFLQNDSTLYFSSGGNHNMGGLDIFYSIRSNGVWSKPKNLGYPINSSMDDFGLVIDKNDKKGYFNSNRNGADMIYSFTKGIPKINVTVKITDKETNGGIRNLPVNLILNNTIDNTAYTDEMGKVNFILAPEKRYKITTGNNSFYYKKIDVNTMGVRESNALNYALKLEQIFLNQEELNYKIKFESKSDVLTQDGKIEVAKLAKKLLNNPNLRIEITSHTDSKGSAASNKSITTQRANTIKNYLVSNGVNSGRIVAIGYGESKLINHCRDGMVCLDEEHAENERIEIKVTGLMP